MRKTEIKMMEKLMNEAIQKATQAQEEYKEAEKLFNCGNNIDAEIKQRKADQYYGEATGIYQALSVLNFSHVAMEVLQSLL